MLEIFFENYKEKGKYMITLINRCSLILPRIQHKVVSLVLQTVFAVRVYDYSVSWNNKALAFEYPCRHGGFSLFVRQISQMCYCCILRLNLTSYLCSEFYGHDRLQTCRHKTRELWGSFAEVREKSVLGFRSCWHFLWKIWFKTDANISNVFIPTRK